VYISVVVDGGRSWIYLTPSGVFSATATAFRKAEGNRSPGGLQVTLNGVGPAGFYLLRVQFVRATAPLPTRTHYAFQPLLATFRVGPRESGEPPGVPVVALLGVATLAVLALTWLLPGPRTDAGAASSERAPAA
jgi:hypothetical protein